MKRLVLIALVSVAAVALSGCGGGSDAPTPEAYADVVVNARDRTDYALERITKAESRDEFLTRMDEAADVINDAASDLESTGVPADFTPEGTRLVRQLYQLAFDVQATADQIRTPGFEDLYTGTRGLSFESWDKVNLQLAGLAGKGIPVTILQPH